VERRKVNPCRTKAIRGSFADCGIGADGVRHEFASSTDDKDFLDYKTG
jgi:hypothetical protein